MKLKLKCWAKENCGRFEKRIQHLEDMIQGIDLSEEDHRLSHSELEIRHNATIKLDEVLKEEDVFWSQRSHALWLKEGDKCSKLFHRMVNSKGTNGHMKSLLIDGSTNEDPDSIKQHVVRYYRDLYTETCEDIPFCGNLCLNTIDEFGSKELEKNFASEEVFTAICSLAGEKSPGPDGFPMIVYKLCWDFMKKEILEVVEEFKDNNYLDWRLNTTFIALIPKKDGEKTIHDFIPISLLFGVYKIIGKTPANRLKGVLPGLISEYQCGGISGRNIHEGILVVNELVDS